MKRIAILLMGLVLLLTSCTPVAAKQNSPVIDADAIDTNYTLPAPASIPGFPDYTVYRIATLKFQWHITGIETSWQGSEVARINIDSDAILLHVDGYMYLNAAMPSTGDWAESTLNINDHGIAEMNIRKQVVGTLGLTDQIFTEDNHWNLQLPLQKGDFIRIGSAISSNTEIPTNAGFFYYIQWIEKPTT